VPPTTPRADLLRVRRGNLVRARYQLEQGRPEKPADWTVALLWIAED
jgi:hypothetical protein